MATFPVFKAGALAVKTLAKPLASVLKESAKDHPLFRKACIRIGQLVHTTSTKLNMRLLGHKVKDIKPRKAIQADSLSRLLLNLCTSERGCSSFPWSRYDGRRIHLFSFIDHCGCGGIPSG